MLLHFYPQLLLVFEIVLPWAQRMRPKQAEYTVPTGTSVTSSELAAGHCQSTRKCQDA